MDNNDILRRLRFILDLSDDAMIDTYGKGGESVSRAEISDWLKKEEDDAYDVVVDENLAVFLNGLIVNFRGKKDGETPVAETELNNNIILRKLKIAFSLDAAQVSHLMKLGGQNVSVAELGSFSRNANHAKYKPCNDQYLRALLKGLQEKRRGKKKK
ncbi:MAG: DUF1456 family protein [Nonlabens sp.]|nr:DUF1456 family protein [Nonlabens sp.]